MCGTHPTQGLKVKQNKSKQLLSGGVPEGRPTQTAARAAAWRQGVPGILPDSPSRPLCRETSLLFDFYLISTDPWPLPRSSLTSSPSLPAGLPVPAGKPSCHEGAVQLKKPGVTGLHSRPALLCSKIIPYVVSFSLMLLLSTFKLTFWWDAHL